MNLATIELRTTEISAAYNLFLAALVGRYLSLRAPGIVVTPQLLTQFNATAHGLAVTFMDIADRALSVSAASMPDGALKTAYNAREIDLRSQLRASIVLNIRDTANWLVRGMPSAFGRPLHGAMGELLQRQLSNPQLKLPDAIGRQWDAYVLIRSTVRDFFYQTALDGVVAEIGQGSGLGQVRYDRAHVRNGMIVSVDDRAGHGIHTSLKAVHEKVFHPNSTAVLEPHV